MQAKMRKDICNNADALRRKRQFNACPKNQTLLSHIPDLIEKVKYLKPAALHLAPELSKATSPSLSTMSSLPSSRLSDDSGVSHKTPMHSPAVSFRFQMKSPGSKTCIGLSILHITKPSRTETKANTLLILPQSPDTSSANFCSTRCLACSPVAMTPLTPTSWLKSSPNANMCTRNWCVQDPTCPPWLARTIHLKHPVLNLCMLIQHLIRCLPWLDLSTLV